MVGARTYIRQGNIWSSTGRAMETWRHKP